MICKVQYINTKMADAECEENIDAESAPSVHMAQPDGGKVTTPKVGGGGSPVKRVKKIPLYVNYTQSKYESGMDIACTARYQHGYGIMNACVLFILSRY